VLELVSTDGPRFDYDPVTLQPKGLLIEEQRTNLLLQSGWAGATTGTPGAAPTSWTLGFGAGVTTTVVDSIYGGIDSAQAIKIEADAGERLFFNQVVNVSAGVTYVVSVFVEQITGAIGRPISVTAGTTTATVTANPDSPTGVSRVILVFTADGTGTVNVRIGVGATAAISAAASVTLSRPQLEAGAFATSYIPTTTAAATRAADVAVMTGANFSNWYNQSEGTLFAEAATTSTANNAGVICAEDGTTNNRIQLRRNASGPSLGLVVVAGGTVQVNGAGGAYPAATSNKATAAYKVDDFVAALSGAVVITDAAGVVPTNNQLVVGAGSGQAALNGHIRRIAYWPRRLTNAELQGVTA
jgi:hypothetical protein